MDIKPGSDPNAINLRQRGVVPVAILTTGPGEDFPPFDVTEINDPTELRLMDLAKYQTGIHPAGAIPVRVSIEDVDGDGDLDLVLFFSTADLASDEVNGGRFDESTTAARLFGPSAGGPIFGDDAVFIVPGSAQPGR